MLLAALLCYGGLGTNAAFFEIAAATYLDGHRNRIRLLPLNLFGFLVSMMTISRAGVTQVIDAVKKRELVWDKTERFRTEAAGVVNIMAGEVPVPTGTEGT